jgi:hypothetical protein
MEFVSVHSIYGMVTCFDEVSFVLTKKVYLKCDILREFITYTLSNVVTEI